MSRRDPADYDGRQTCARCSRDASGDYWPICADARPDGTRYTHEESCERYATIRGGSADYDDWWLCDPCERLMVEEIAAVA